MGWIRLKNVQAEFFLNMFKLGIVPLQERMTMNRNGGAGGGGAGGALDPSLVFRKNKELRVSSAPSPLPNPGH